MHSRRVAVLVALYVHCTRAGYDWLAPQRLDDGEPRARPGLWGSNQQGLDLIVMNSTPFRPSGMQAGVLSALLSLSLSLSLCPSLRFFLVSNSTTLPPSHTFELLEAALPILAVRPSAGLAQTITNLNECPTVTVTVASRLGPVRESST